MKPFLKWLHLRPADRSLMVQALVILTVARLGLKLFPLETLRNALGWVATALAELNQTDKFDKERVPWAVETVSAHLLDQASCLAKAVTVQQMLLTRGTPAELQIGVAKGMDGRLEAHAWVESEGRIIIGGPITMVERYQRLPSLDGRRT